MRQRIALAGLLLMLMAVTPAQSFNGTSPAFPIPYGYGGTFVQLGWYNGAQAWHFCAATNSIGFTYRTATGSSAVLAPKLTSALTPKVTGGDTAARPMLLVTNFQNPPVFSTAPGQPLYSALWQIYTVTWKPGVSKRPITSTEPASAANPAGLPDATQVDIVPTQAVLDCPIVVLGPLVGTGTCYTIPQTDHIVAAQKLVFLPAWLTYCQDPVTKRVNLGITLITDASSPELAALVGANVAPGLLNLPDSDTTDFLVLQGPRPLNQYPIVSDCPTAASFRNTNYGYSPVMRYILLDRHIPPYTLVKTISYAELLFGSGGLTLVSDEQRINAPTFGPP